jgi:Beta-propeller repeat
MQSKVRRLLVVLAASTLVASIALAGRFRLHSGAHVLTRQAALGSAAAQPDTVSSQAALVDQATRTRINDAYMELPLRFEANQGQTDQAVRYISRGPGHSLFLTSGEAVLALSRHVRPEGKPPNLLSRRDRSTPTSSAEQAAISMRFLGSDSAAEVKGEQELPCRVNYFKGNDPAKWRTDVPTYSRVKYKGVYPGVDLIYYGSQQQLEYDFVVSAGADPGQIRFAFEGADRPEINAGGELVLNTPLGEVQQKKPLLYQEEGGVRREVEGRYVVGGAGDVSFEVGEYDRGKELVIDPVLLYSTYLGGDSFEIGDGIAVDKSGRAYVTGETLSTDFPTVNALQPTFGSFHDVFVSELSIWSINSDDHHDNRENNSDEDNN